MGKLDSREVKNIISIWKKGQQEQLITVLVHSLDGNGPRAIVGRARRWLPGKTLCQEGVWRMGQRRGRLLEAGVAGPLSALRSGEVKAAACVEDTS